MSATFQLNGWRVEPDQGRIIRGSTVTHLRPQVMGLLVLLARRPGRAVSTEEILDVLWANKFASSESVYNCVRELRRALGDDPHHPEFIQTIPKVGYRLRASAVTGARPQGRAGPGPGVRAAAILLAAAVGILFYFVLRSPGAGDSGHPVIAVVPFEMRGLADEGEYLQRGLAEELISALGGVQGLAVMGPGTSFRLPGDPAERLATSRKVGVSHLLSGSLERRGGTMLVLVELTPAAEGEEPWFGQYEVEYGKFDALRQRITADVAARLGLISPSRVEEIASEGESSWVSVDAFELYLLAKHRDRQYDEPGSARDAVGMLERALALDPGFAEAATELASGLMSLAFLDPGYFGSATRDPDLLWKELSVRVHELLDQAIRTRPGLAQAHAHKARALMFDGDLKAAQASLETALALNPSLPDTHYIQLELATRQHQSWRLNIEIARRAVRLEPLVPENHVFLADVLFRIPQLRAESWQVFKNLGSSGILDFDAAPVEAYLLQQEGRLANAARLLEHFRAGHPNDRSSGIDLAKIWRLLGEPERAASVHPDPLPGWPRARRPDATPVREACGLPNPDLGSLRQNQEAYVCLLEHQPAGVLEQFTEYLEQPVAFRERFDEMSGSLYSPAFSLAASLILSGEESLAAPFMRLEREALDAVWESGQIDSPEAARSYARLLALEGRGDEALDELEAMLEFGDLDPRVFQNPVFDALRNHPRFVQLQGERLRRVNEERVQLGLQRL